jgi:hypothetical protein
MTPQLPTELIIRIIHLVAPLDYSPIFYLERRRILRCLSLVSKTFCAVAQPMLPQVYSVGMKKDLRHLKHVVGGQKRGEQIRLLAVAPKLVFDKDADELVNSIEMEDIVEACPGVIDFRLSGGGEFHLQVLSRLTSKPLFCFPVFREKLTPRRTDLRRLIIHCTPDADVYLHSLSSGITLPSLVELSLSMIQFDSKFWKGFPSARSTPQLRALGVSYSDDGMEALSADGASLPRLDIFQLKPYDTSPSHVVSTPSVLPLLNCHLDSSSLSDFFASCTTFPRHLRLYFENGEHDDEIDDEPQASTAHTNRESITAVLTTFLGILEGRLFTQLDASSLRTLGLPLAIHPSRMPHVDAQESIQKVLDHCEKRGVEVVWEEQRNENWDSVVSPAFWSIAKRMRSETTQ